MTIQEQFILEVKEELDRRNMKWIDLGRLLYKSNYGTNNIYTLRKNAKKNSISTKNLLNIATVLNMKLVICLMEDEG